MLTNERRGMVIQDRDLHLLRELALLRIIDREQAKLVGGFRSTTRVNARLLALCRAGLLKRYLLGTNGAGQKAIYGISRRGAQFVDAHYRGLQRRADEPIIADLFVQHQLMVNDIFCLLKYTPVFPPGVEFRRWLHFFEPVVPEIRLIPDGYVEFCAASENIACFLEVDRGVESLRIWTEKVRRYLELAVSGAFERNFHEHRFRVLVIVNSLRRLHSIRRAVAPITPKMLWFATFSEAHGPSFFRTCWFRPTGDHCVSLIRQLP